MDELWIELRTVEQAEADRAPVESDAWLELCDMIDGGAFDEHAEPDDYVPLDMGVPADAWAEMIELYR